MQIHQDNPAHFADFVRLNNAWISQFFALEPGDIALAADPGRVLRQGGHIYTATVGDTVAGTSALFFHADGGCELARMAVDPAFQGQGIGRALALHALEQARALGTARVFLMSNTSLAPAISLYRSLGFHVVSEGPHPLYARCNIVMEIVLSAS